MLFPPAQYAQDFNHPMNVQVMRFGSAEAKMVTPDSGFYPAWQPEVYWHDDQWKIDLLPLATLGDAYRVKITSVVGSGTNIVQLPEGYGLIRKIVRNPNDQAVVIADLSGTATSFCIVDLKLAKITDEIAMYTPSISPDRRFVLYINGFPPHGPYGEAQYRLYDTIKSPSENTCGFRQNDPGHKDLDESYRGFAVYPLVPKGNPCVAELPDGEDHLRVSKFVWSADSSKVLFADAHSGTITLVVVQMPSGAKGLPLTFLYPLTGLENVCEKECVYRNLHSLTWEDDHIRAALAHSPVVGPEVEKVLSIPLSKFTGAQR